MQSVVKAHGLIAVHCMAWKEGLHPTTTGMPHGVAMCKCVHGEGKVGRQEWQREGEARDMLHRAQVLGV